MRFGTGIGFQRSIVKKVWIEKCEFTRFDLTQLGWIGLRICWVKMQMVPEDLFSAG